MTATLDAALAGMFVVPGNHSNSDYFGLIKELVRRKNDNRPDADKQLAAVYELLFDEIIRNNNPPSQRISFGTSGWRGKLGKDISCRSVVAVTEAIVRMYREVDTDQDIQKLLGVGSFLEATQKGCVLGHDNRFAGELLCNHVAETLVRAGFVIHYAGESTTGVLSAAVLELGAAFSVNLTPSHNPLEYGGYKFNAADAGPAESRITERITELAQKIVIEEYAQLDVADNVDVLLKNNEQVRLIDSFSLWKSRVKKNFAVHGLSLERAVAAFQDDDEIAIVVDCVHGASRLHIGRFFNDMKNSRLQVLRDTADVTFGGIAPEPSSKNMQGVGKVLSARKERLKLGAIIDPDGDRIRFTDGTIEISMNQFGAMAYHFLHKYKKKTGMVAKTVATSNLANAVASGCGEDVFEPPVGFKYFKPVFGSALVCFEESDGISIIGHTPEKDAYIGLLLAIEMIETTGKNLGDYLAAIEEEFGGYYPDRDGIEVSIKGEPLLETLAGLEKYQSGSKVVIGGKTMTVAEVITVDGRKMVLEDGSWLMIRPSGTEPKVRFYVESRTRTGTRDLVLCAKEMLSEIGIL